MSLIKKLRKESAPVRLFFATLPIIPIQAWLLISTITEASISRLQDTPQFFFPDTLTTGFAYFVLPIIYCIIVSLLFHPKRIVSPLWVQIGTQVIFSAIVITNVMPTADFTVPETYGNLVGSLLLTALLAIMIGFIQEIIVKKVVALNFEDCDRVSFTVDMNPKDFLKTVGDDLRDVWEFNRKKDNPKAKPENIIWVLRTNDSYSNYVIITVGSVRGNENKSIIATVAYHASAYGISKSENASKMRNSIIRDINGLLAENNKPTLSPTEEMDDAISVKAYNHTLAVTRPKTAIVADFFKRIRRYYLFAMIFTIVTFIATTIAWMAKVIGNSDYINSIILIGVALVVELGASLAEEWYRREEEEID
jgi:hypothetical protein